MSNLTNGMIMHDMRLRLSILTDKIVEDYLKAYGDLVDTNQEKKTELTNEIKSKISYNCARKYLKVNGKYSIWGFIVNVHDDPKFKYGDILKAKSWRGPERNFARGHVFDDNGFCHVLWTGPV